MRKDAGLLGKKFSDVVVIKQLGIVKGFIRYLYRCKCGTEKEATGHNLLKGHVLSCGCLSSFNTTKRNTSHGKSKIREYRIWFNMKARCLNKNHTFYKNYGGRGVKVCNRWLKFENFYADMGISPSLKHTLDRIKNDGHYTPSNCRWATRTQQANNKRTNKKFTFNKMTLTLSEWSKVVNIGASTLWHRIYRQHKSIGNALTDPIR